MAESGGKKTLLQVILPFLLLGGGSVAGFSASGWIGAAIGAGAGLVVLVLIFFLILRPAKESPGCRCGQSKSEELEYKRDKNWGFVHKCAKCGRSYMLFNEMSWEEVLPDGARVPYKAKNAMGRWKDVAGSPS